MTCSRYARLTKKDPQPLQVKEDSEKHSCVQGLTSFEVASKEEAFFLLSKGGKRSIVRETEANIQSSRAHTLLTLECVQPGDGGRLSSRLNLCDLAGSERMNERVFVKDARFHEMKYINLSLTALGKVIRALSLGGSFLPPFRESALTRLLKSSFLASSHAVLIIGLKPESDSLEETMNTIRFSKLAKKVRIRTEKQSPVRQSKVLEQEHASNTGNLLLSTILEENIQLKKELSRLRFKFSSKTRDAGESLLNNFLQGPSQ